MSDEISTSTDLVHVLEKLALSYTSGAVICGSHMYRLKKKKKKKNIKQNARKQVPGIFLSRPYSKKR
jgi:hypothetical protein